MGAKKIIEGIVEFLNISNFTTSGKKKALKKLLKKLKERHTLILQKLKEERPALEEKRLREELAILSFHIAKAEQKLSTL